MQILAGLGGSAFALAPLGRTAFAPAPARHHATQCIAPAAAMPSDSAITRLPDGTYFNPHLGALNAFEIDVDEAVIDEAANIFYGRDGEVASPFHSVCSMSDTDDDVQELYCASQWCYVDTATCDVEHSISTFSKALVLRGGRAVTSDVPEATAGVALNRVGRAVLGDASRLTA